MKWLCSLAGRSPKTTCANATLHVLARPINRRGKIPLHIEPDLKFVEELRGRRFESRRRKDPDPVRRAGPGSDAGVLGPDGRDRSGCPVQLRRHDGSRAVLARTVSSSTTSTPLRFWRRRSPIPRNTDFRTLQRHAGRERPPEVRQLTSAPLCLPCKIPTCSGTRPPDAEGLCIVAEALRAGRDPEPSTWAMMLLGLAGLGFTGAPGFDRRPSAQLSGVGLRSPGPPRSRKGRDGSGGLRKSILRFDGIEGRIPLLTANQRGRGALLGCPFWIRMAAARRRSHALAA